MKDQAMIDYTKTVVQEKKYDEGLRSYILKIYNYMACALCLSGIMGFASLKFPPLSNMLYNFAPGGEFIGNTTFGTLIAFAPIILSFYFIFRVHHISVEKARLIFWIYAGLMGISLSYLGIIFDVYSVMKSFFITASVFGVTSIYGHYTKRDLTNFGSFLIMGLIGIILISLVNLILRSPAIDFAISFLGVGIFIGLIAWDTQKIKNIYYSVGGESALAQRMAIVGAFTLYLDFINLFIHILRFFGNSRNN